MDSSCKHIQSIAWRTMRVADKVSGGKRKEKKKSKINKTRDSEGKAQCGSCHGRLGGQAALLEFCYLSAAESRPAEKGADFALRQDTHTARALFNQACVFSNSPFF